jgi:plasmid stability protein
MASITVRNLDDDVKHRLRIRAAGKGRSLEAEVRDILVRSVQASSGPQAKTGLDLFKPIQDVVRRYGGVELKIPPRTPMRDVELGSAPRPNAGGKDKVVSRRDRLGDSTLRETHRDTSTSTLRKTHGEAFATGVRGEAKLQNLVRDVAADFRWETDGKRPNRRKK